MMKGLKALSDRLRDSAPRKPSGGRGPTHFWQYAPEVPPHELDQVLELIGGQIAQGRAQGEVRYDLILFHLLRTRLTNVHGNRLWPEVSQALWPRSATSTRAELAARFFRTQLSAHHEARLVEISEHRRFLCLAFEQAGVGYNRLDTILRFLEYAIEALPNPVEQPPRSQLSALVSKFTVREPGLIGLESTLLASLEAVVLVRATLAARRKLFVSRLWAFETLREFALAETNVDLARVIPEARHAFLHAFRFGSRGHLTQAEAYELRLSRDCVVELPPSNPTSPIGVPIGPARISIKGGDRHDLQICGEDGNAAPQILGAARAANVINLGGRDFLVDRSLSVDRRVSREHGCTRVYLGTTVDDATLAIVLRLRPGCPSARRDVQKGTDSDASAKLGIQGTQVHAIDAVRVECEGEAAITFPGAGAFELTIDTDAGLPDHVCVSDEHDNWWNAPISFVRGKALLTYADLGALGIAAPGLYRFSCSRSGIPHAPMLLVLGDAVSVENSPIGHTPHLHLISSGSHSRASLAAEETVTWDPDEGAMPSRVQARVITSAARMTVTWPPSLCDCALFVGRRLVDGSIDGSTGWHPDAAFHAVGGHFALALEGNEGALAKVADRSSARAIFESLKSAGVEMGVLRARSVSSGAVDRKWHFDIRAHATVFECVLVRDAGDVRLTLRGEVVGSVGALVETAISYSGAQLTKLATCLDQSNDSSGPLPFLISTSVPSMLVPRLAGASVTLLVDGRRVEVPAPKTIGSDEQPHEPEETPAVLKSVLAAAKQLLPEVLTARLLDLCLRSATSSGAFPLPLDVIDGRLASAEHRTRASVMFTLRRIDAQLRQVHTAPLDTIRADMLDPAADIVITLELLGEISRSARGQMDPQRVRTLAGLLPASVQGERGFLAAEAVAIVEHRPPQEGLGVAAQLSSLRARFGFRADALAIIDRRYQQSN